MKRKLGSNPGLLLLMMLVTGMGRIKTQACDAHDAGCWRGQGCNEGLLMHKVLVADMDNVTLHQQL